MMVPVLVTLLSPTLQSLGEQNLRVLCNAIARAGRETVQGLLSYIGLYARMFRKFIWSKGILCARFSVC